VGGELDKLATEVLEHDRRITRLEAQWDTALQLGGRSAPKRVTRKRENDKE